MHIIANLLLTASGLLPIAAHAAGTEGLKVEQRVSPCGIDVAQPHFSWLITSEKQNEIQTAYEIEVSQNGNGVWGSGKVASGQSVAVPYRGTTLQSQTAYQWRVRVWDKDGCEGGWSEPAFLVTGVLGEPWQGKWIAGDYGWHHDAPNDRIGGDTRASDGNLPVFKKEIAIDKEVREAIVSICGLGQYELFLNGKKVGNDLLAPGWTNYRSDTSPNGFTPDWPASNPIQPRRVGRSSLSIRRLSGILPG